MAVTTYTEADIENLLSRDLKKLTKKQLAYFLGNEIKLGLVTHVCIFDPSKPRADIESAVSDWIKIASQSI